jgi:hypothetical protein
LSVAVAVGHFGINVRPVAVPVAAKLG